MTLTIDPMTIWGSQGFASRDAWLDDIHAKEAARVAAIRNNPLAIVVQDAEGTWHLRDDADQYIPYRTQFAWFLCGTKDEDDNINSIEAVDVALSLTTFSQVCQKCAAPGSQARQAVAPDWLLEVPGE